MIASKVLRSTALLAAAGAGVAVLAMSSPASAEVREQAPTALEAAAVPSGPSYQRGATLYALNGEARRVPLAGMTLSFYYVSNQGQVATCSAVTNSNGFGACLPAMVPSGGLKVTFAGTSTYASSSLVYTF